MLVVAVLAGCGPRTDSRSSAIDESQRARPGIDAMTTVADRAELALLNQALGDPGRLGALASFYQQQGAWDEYSAVRSRMLELAPPPTHPGPAPGGPFPRIGVPREGARPPTFLGRWLNPTDLPELYEQVQVTSAELERRLRSELDRDPSSAQALVRLGDALCASLRFADAESLYTRAASAGHQRARERLGDLQRVLHGPALE